MKTHFFLVLLWVIWVAMFILGEFIRQNRQNKK